MSVRLRSAHEERNSWAPISRLPPELLSAIFCFVRLAVDENWEGLPDGFGIPLRYHRRFEVKRWMNISHVCHAWREVAINTVSLWSHIFLTSRNYKWVEECLRRSKQSSLVLYADFSENQNPPQNPSRAVLHGLRNHLGRCQVLSLQLTTRDFTDLLSETETPRLVDFHYSHLSTYESLIGPRSSQPLIGDSILRADSLRRLSISYCPVDCSASIFHRLTHLQLRYIPNKSRLKCHAFVSFLIGMPSLEVLDLCEFLQRGEINASHGKADRLYLHHLKYVELDDNPPDIADLLSSILIPPLCKILIFAEGYPDMMAEDYQLTLSWACNHFHPPISESSVASDPHQNYWRSLRIFYLESSFGFEGYTIEENLERNKSLFTHTIWYLQDPADDHYLENLPQLLFMPLPISCIVYLEISSDFQRSVLSKSMWVEIFGSISTLKSICIEAKSLPFFEALSHDPLQSLDFEFVPFPALTSVVVREDRNPGPDYDAVLRSLCWRSRLRAPLKRLAMEDCLTVPPFVLKQLKEVVGEVEIRDRLVSEL